MTYEHDSNAWDWPEGPLTPVDLGLADDAEPHLDDEPPF